MALRISGQESSGTEEKVVSRNGNLLKSMAPVLLAGALAAPQAGAMERVAADARRPVPPMSLVVIEDLPGSDAILGGDYGTGLGQALAALEAAPGRRVVPLATNICAAQAMLGDYEQASAWCERAVAGRAAAGSNGAEARLFQAAALVNRGVLRALQGNRPAAEADFDSATRHYASLAVARGNLERIRSAEPAGPVLVGKL